MKFRFYITDTTNGMIVGTNDFEVAQGLAESEDNFVVDAQSNQWLQPDGESVPVQEYE